MNPTHHLEHSQRYLNFAALDTAAGDCSRAAHALTRAASHAVTAAAVHWHDSHHSRRRLTTVLGGLVHNNRVAHTHRRTFRDVYQLPRQVAATGTDVSAARRLLRRFRRRVNRLLAAIRLAIAAHPNPPTMDEICARLTAEPDHPLLVSPSNYRTESVESTVPPVWTVAQASQVLGSHFKPEYAAQLAPDPICFRWSTR